MGTDVDTMRRSPYNKNTTRASGMTYDFVHSKHSVANRASSSGESGTAPDEARLVMAE
ncbi:hypothetical protein VB005_08484 [Metarhizium brunneum]